MVTKPVRPGSCHWPRALWPTTTTTSSTPAAPASFRVCKVHWQFSGGTCFWEKESPVPWRFNRVSLGAYTSYFYSVSRLIFPTLRINGRKSLSSRLDDSCLPAVFHITSPSPSNSTGGSPPSPHNCHWWCPDQVGRNILSVLWAGGMSATVLCHHPPYHFLQANICIIARDSVFRPASGIYWMLHCEVYVSPLSFKLKSKLKYCVLQSRTNLSMKKPTSIFWTSLAIHHANKS